MTFALVGGGLDQFAAANDSAAASSWSPTTRANISVGHLAILAIALDNLGTSDAETSQVTAVSIGSDNFTKAVEYTNGSPGAGSGATVSIWWKVIANASSSGATISISLSGSTTKKTIIGHLYTRDSSKTVQVMSGTKATGEAKSITSGTITNAVEALVFRGLAIEDNENAIDTATTDWTAGDDSLSFTTGGGAAANMAGGAEWRILTGSGAGVTSNPGGTSSGDMASAIIAFEEVSAGDRTLTCGSGSYSISGTAVALERSRIMAAASASYSISGAAATLAKGRPIAASSGSYSISGTAAVFNRTYVMAANTASYAITGTAAVLAQGYKLVADTVAYVITGTAAALVRGKALAAGAGSYAISGATAVFLRGMVLAAATGSYAITGTSVAFLLARRLVAAAGSYAISGTAALMEIGRKLVAATGSYVLTGTDAVFTYAVNLWQPISPTSGSWSDTAEGSGTWTPIDPTTGNWS